MPFTIPTPPDYLHHELTDVAELAYQENQEATLRNWSNNKAELMRQQDINTPMLPGDLAKVTDIIIKGGEDLRAGMWCTGNWFLGVDDDGDPTEEGWGDQDFFGFLSNQWFYAKNLIFEDEHMPEEGGLSIEKALKSMRCAEGSLALSAAMMEPNPIEAQRLYNIARKEILRDLPLGYDSIYSWNDGYLSHMEDELWNQVVADNPHLFNSELGIPLPPSAFKKRNKLHRDVTEQVGAFAADQFRVTSDRLQGLL